MPVEARHSATVILVRPVPPVPADATAYEVFMVRRPVRIEFAPDVYVFQGGTVRADDRLSADAPPTGLDAAVAHARLAGETGAGGPTPADSLALWIAALRELFEEAGVLLAEGPDGELVHFDEPAVLARFAAARTALQAGELSLGELAAREGLTLAPERLHYWAHWITPLPMPRRYNTRFFLAPMPSAQEALHCAVETTDGVWIAPSVAVARHAADDFPLVFATASHLRRLADFPTLEALWTHVEGKAVVTVLPVAEGDPRAPRLTIPPEVAECW